MEDNSISCVESSISCFKKYFDIITHFPPNIIKSSGLEENQKDGGQNASAVLNPNGPLPAIFGRYSKWCLEKQ